MRIVRGYPLDLILAEFGNEAYRAARRSLILAARANPLLRKAWIDAKSNLDARFESIRRMHEDKFEAENTAIEKSVAISTEWKPRWEDAPYVSREADDIPF